MSSRVVAVAALVMAMVSASACSRTGSSALDQTSVASTSPPSVPSPHISTDATAGMKVTFDYTDPAGWHYSGSFPLPSRRAISFSKDVSSSPPGMAKIIPKLLNSQVDPTSPNDNPGRQGPQLKVTGYLAYPVPANNQGPTFGEPCGYSAGDG